MKIEKCTVYTVLDADTIRVQFTLFCILYLFKRIVCPAFIFKKLGFFCIVFYYIPFLFMLLVLTLLTALSLNII